MSKNVYDKNTYSRLQRKMNKNIYCSVFYNIQILEQVFSSSLIKVWYSHSTLQSS